MNFFLILNNEFYDVGLENCVGFYHHRYFYQFCCFMSIGCLYAEIFGYRDTSVSN
jgi:palmitoyltransferase